MFIKINKNQQKFFASPYHKIRWQSCIKDLVCVLLLVFVFVLIARAQIPNIGIALVSSPSSPSLGETVQIQATTPTFDKDTAFFSWTINGASRKDLSGFGKNIITLAAGGTGSSVRISVAVTPINQGEKNASLTIYVSNLALGWVAHTWVPKWYQGKALPTQDSIIDVVAIPTIILNGKMIPASELLYRWTLDGQENVLSGIGAQTLRFRASDLPKSLHNIRVIITDINGRIKKEGKIFIAPTSPAASLYLLTPLGGIEPRNALSQYEINTRGTFDFQAEPFFFPVFSKTDLGFGWFLGQTLVSGSPENPHNLTIDTEKQPAGEIPISVTITNKNNKQLPSASGFVNLVFK